MKRLLSFVLALTCAGYLWAVVTPASTDFVDYCTGANNSNCVYQIDSSGNQTNAGNLTTQGALSVTGASTLTGAVSAAATYTTTGKTVYTPTNFTNFFSSNSVPVTATYVTILSSAGNLLMGGTPTVATTTLTSSNWNTSLPKTVSGISNIADGTWLIIASTSTQAIKFQDNSILSNSLLNLGGTGVFIVSSTSTLNLIFNGTTGSWNQVSRP